MEPFDPLRIELEFARQQDAGDPYGFRFMPQEYLCRTSGGGFETALLSWDEMLLDDLQALQEPVPDPVLLQRIGELLRNFVTPLGWDKHEQALIQAASAERRVVLTIRSAAAELYTLPWELLTLKASGQCVGELPGVLLRYEWPETTTTPEQPLPRLGGGRILLAWSAAGGSVPATAHLVAIADACQDAGHPFDAQRDVLAHASCRQLSATLAAARQTGQPISVLHLLCHGGQAGTSFALLLDEDNGVGGAIAIDAGRLRRLLAPYAGMVRLVVLMACNSGNPGALGNQLGSIAQTLHRLGIAAVVTSRYPLSVDGSIRLTETMYKTLLPKLESLESALLLARAQLLEANGGFDWASLQLYARAADGDDTRPVLFRPYQGLKAYSLQERHFFFGREELSTALWKHFCTLHQDRQNPTLLAVIGPSGSGKSSVACAGLLAQLEQRSTPGVARWRTVVLRPGSHPLDALASALRGLRAADLARPLVVLVDQLEEIYTLCSDSVERSAFVDLLLDAARNPAWQVAVVLTLRSDFLGETQRHNLALNRLIARQCMVVGGMNAAELRCAVAEPARRVGRPIDETTIDLLLSQASGSDGTLPLLSFALSRMFEGMLAARPPRLTLHELGGVGGALAGEARRIYGELSPREQMIARRALVRLVKLGEGARDTRRRASISELVGRGVREEEVLRVLRCFAGEQARLLTLSGETEAPLAEVTHEALFDSWTELREWIDIGRPDRRFHDRATEAAQLWNEAGRLPGRLWRPPDLDLLRNYAERRADDLSPLVDEFLRAAVEQQEAERAAKQAAERHLREVHEQIRQQLLATYVDEGRRLMVKKDRPLEALLWLHRAQTGGSRAPQLPYLLAEATRHLDAATAVLVSHNAELIAARFSPDGRRIVTADKSGWLCTWDADTGQILLRWAARARGSVCFSSDGRRIFTTREDGTAQEWEADTGQLLAEHTGYIATHAGQTAAVDEWSTPAEFQDYAPRVTVHSESYSSDGRFLVTASSDNRARIWEVASGRLVTECRGHSGPLWCARFSADGYRIATASSDKTARIWMMVDGNLLAECKGHEGAVLSVAFSPDGRRIVTASEDQTARIWDADSGRLLAECRGLGGRMQDAQFSPDGRSIVTASQAKLVGIWAAHNGRLLAKFRGHVSSVETAVFSPDGSRILTASQDQTARVWSTRRSKPITELVGHVAPIRSVRFSADGSRVVTGSQDQTARIWEASNGQLLAELKSHGDVVEVAEFSPDGSRVATVSASGTTEVWDAERATRLAVITDRKLSRAYVCFSPDSRQILIIQRAGMLRLCDTDSGRLLAAVGESQITHAAEFSPDGSRILTANEDQRARLWTADGSRVLTVFAGHKGAVKYASFSSDGRRIVTASSDLTACVWDTESGRLLVELKGHLREVEFARFSADGGQILTSSSDNTVRLWAADSGRQLLVLAGQGYPMKFTGFSPDGTRLWAAESGQQVKFASFSPDGTQILTAAPEQPVRLGQAPSGKLLAEFPAQVDSSRGVSFSPDGRRIITTSQYHSAQIWSIAPETRGADEIGALIRRRLGLQFSSPDSNVIVPKTPEPR